MHLKNIGVENFRVFGEKTEFRLRPITVYIYYFNHISGPASISKGITINNK